MQIMCLNGWGGKRHESLLSYLQEACPDVLCLQEVVHSPETRKDWLVYRDGDHVLPQRANFFSDVSAVLPDHVAIFCPAAQGVLWDDDVAIASQWGLATFVHRSLPIIGQVQTFVHKAFSAEGYGEHPRSRSAHGVMVYDYTSSRSIAVAHMHGLRDLNGKMDTPERSLQAQRFLHLINEVSDGADITIACGDFNVEPQSETLKRLKAKGLTELVTSRGFSGTRTSQYTKPGKFADYMLVDREEVITRFDVIYDPEVSDHCPLLLEL